MPLPSAVDDMGILWFENPPVAGRRRLKHLAASVGTAAAVAWLLPSWVPFLDRTVCGWPLLGLAILSFTYVLARTARPYGTFAAPRRVGFTDLELHLEAEQGAVERIRWRDIQSLALDRDIGLSSRLRLDQARGPREVRVLHLDLAVLVRWAHRYGIRGAFDASTLTEPPPAFPLTEVPEGGVPVDGADPAVFLYRDRFVVWTSGRGAEVRREDADAVVFSMFGKPRLVILSRWHVVSTIIRPDKISAIQMWLAEGSRDIDTAASWR